MSTNTFGWASASLALASLAAVAGAQDVCYPQVTSATITECVPNTGTPKPTPCGAACPNPLVSGGPKGGPITVAVPMPSCQECGCATCVHANVYTTSFAAFCPEGITTQVYVVKELYTGLPAPPSITQRPDVPMGFVQGVQTCNSCGPKPITTQLTYPADGCPFVGGQSGPAPAPGGIPGWVVSPDKGGPGYTPSQDGKGWVPAPPKPEGGSYGYPSPVGSYGAQAGVIAGAAAGPGSSGDQAGAQAGAQAAAAAGSGSSGAQAVQPPGAGPAAGPGSNVAQGAAPAGVGGAVPVGPADSPGKAPGSGPDKPSGPPAPVSDKPASPPAPGSDKPASPPAPGSDKPAGPPAPGSDKPAGPPAPGSDKPAGPPAPGSDKPAGPPSPGIGESGYQQVSGAWVPTIFSALAITFSFFSIAIFAL